MFVPLYSKITNRSDRNFIYLVLGTFTVFHNWGHKLVAINMAGDFLSRVPSDNNNVGKYVHRFIYIEVWIRVVPINETLIKYIQLIVEQVAKRAM